MIGMIFAFSHGFSFLIWQERKKKSKIKMRRTIVVQCCTKSNKENNKI